MTSRHETFYTFHHTMGTRIFHGKETAIYNPNVMHVAVTQSGSRGADVCKLFSESESKLLCRNDLLQFFYYLYISINPFMQIIFPQL